MSGDAADMSTSNDRDDLVDPAQDVTGTTTAAAAREEQQRSTSTHDARRTAGHVPPTRQAWTDPRHRSLPHSTAGHHVPLVRQAWTDPRHRGLPHNRVSYHFDCSPDCLSSEKLVLQFQAQHEI